MVETRVVRYFKLNFALVYFSFIAYIYDQIIPLYFQKAGLNPFQISLIFGAGTIAFTIWSVYTGTLYDLYGRKKLIFSGLILGILGQIFFIVSINPITLTIAKILDIMAWVSVFYALLYHFEDKISYKNRGYKTGILLAISDSMKVVAPFAGGFLADKFTITTPFFVSLVLYTLMLIVVYFKKTEEDKEIVKEKKTSFAKRTELFFKSLKFFWNIPKLRWVAIGGIFLLAALNVFLIFSPLYLKDLGFSLTQIGFTYTLYILGSMTYPFFGALTDKGGRLLLMFSSLIFSSLFILAFSYAISPITIYVVSALIGAVTSGWAIAMFAMLSDFGEFTGKEGSILGSYFAITRIGSLVGQLIGGAIAFYDIRLSFIVFSVILFFFSFVFYFKTYKLPKFREVYVGKARLK